MHNWTALMHMFITNATGKTLDSEDGDWDTALFQLICEAYQQKMDYKDKEVVCVLISLHEAIKGKTSLTALAQMCVSFTQAKPPVAPIKEKK